MPDLITKLCTNLTTSSFTTKPVIGRFTNWKLAGGKQAILRISRGGVATPAGNVTVHGANIPDPWANRAGTGVWRQRRDVTDANWTTADSQFQSLVPFVAFSNYNWFAMLSEMDRFVLPIGTSLGGVISSGTGANARLDFTSENKTGDGTTTVFDLLADFDILTHCNLRVTVNGVVQASSAFALSNNAGKIRITFTAAPGNTLAIVHQLYPKPGKQFGLAFTVPVTTRANGVIPQFNDEIATRDAHWVVTGAGVTGNIDVALEAFGM